MPAGVESDVLLASDAAVMATLSPAMAWDRVGRMSEGSNASRSV